MGTKRHLTDRSLLILWLLLALALPFMGAPHAFGSTDRLDQRYDRISSSAAGANARHAFGMQISNTSVPLGSISFEFCSNSAIVGDTCTAPTGLDLSGLTLQSQTGEVGFSISGFTTANKIVLTRPASLPAGGLSEYTFANIINPTVAASYFVRLETFTSTDGTGANVEEGGVVFVINGGLSVAAEVPPYLRLCVSVTITGFDCSSANSYFIDLGEFSTASPKVASSEIVAATNASFGYSITVSGTALTSGNNVIQALLPATGSSPGTSQFGINLRNNSNPSIGQDPFGPGIGSAAPNYNNPNQFRFQNGDVIASSTNSSDNTKYTVSYLVNISQSQPPGVYATTLTYIALANF